MHTYRPVCLRPLKNIWIMVLILSLVLGLSLISYIPEELVKPLAAKSCPTECRGALSCTSATLLLLCSVQHCLRIVLVPISAVGLELTLACPTPSMHHPQKLSKMRRSSLEPNALVRDPAKHVGHMRFFFQPKVRSSPGRDGSISDSCYSVPTSSTLPSITVLARPSL